jgi:hypothetical protein
MLLKLDGKSLRQACVSIWSNPIPNRFHHGWCNTPAYMNTTLHKPQIVLVSDPFTKDSAHPAVPDSSQRSRCKIRAIQPEDLSADA